jgi:hypothetical protein
MGKLDQIIPFSIKEEGGRRRGEAIDLYWQLDKLLGGYDEERKIP